jgi:hypothetical protein
LSSSISNFIDRAGRWFLDSGIQEPGGGVARYRRTDTGRNQPISNEITGYAAGTLVYLHSLTGDRAYLDKAVAAARFLTRTAWDDARQIFPFEYAPPGNALAYFFDCGIIARGLLAVWRATGAQEFLARAVACGTSMARDFAGAEAFHPVLQLPDKQPLAYDHQWSRSPGCYQLKSALAWYDLYDETGDAAFQRCYQRALDYSLHAYAAFLPGDPDPNRVMDRLHAYCYFLEGLLPCAGHKPCAAALCDGLRRVAGYLREIAPAFARSDVYAQLLRLRLFADWSGIVPVDRDAACWEAGRLREFQCAQTGGFYFGQKDGRMLPFINPVSAAFGLQALAMWRDFEAGAPPLHRHALI